MSEKLFKEAIEAILKGDTDKATDEDETQYLFESREALDIYLEHNAPDLREKGAKRFDSSKVYYTRRIGDYIWGYLPDIG